MKLLRRLRERLHERERVREAAAVPFNFGLDHAHCERCGGVAPKQRWANGTENYTCSKSDHFWSKRVDGTKAIVAGPVLE